MREFTIGNMQASYGEYNMNASAFTHFYYAGNKQGSHQLTTPALRWVSRDRRKHIIEQSPSFHDHFIEPQNKSISIPHPWTIYGISITDYGELNKVWMYARNSPISSMDDPLYVHPLNVSPRVYGDYVQLPESELKIVREEIPLKSFTRTYTYHKVSDEIAQRKITDDIKEKLLPDEWEKDFRNYLEYLEYIETMPLEKMNYSAFKDSGTRISDLVETLENTTKKAKINNVFDYIETAFK